MQSPEHLLEKANLLNDGEGEWVDNSYPKT